MNHLKTIDIYFILSRICMLQRAFSLSDNDLNYQSGNAISFHVNYILQIILSSIILYKQVLSYNHLIIVKTMHFNLITQCNKLHIFI